MKTSHVIAGVVALNVAVIAGILVYFSPRSAEANLVDPEPQPLVSQNVEVVEPDPEYAEKVTCWRGISSITYEEGVSNVKEIDSTEAGVIIHFTEGLSPAYVEYLNMPCEVTAIHEGT